MAKAPGEGVTWRRRIIYVRCAECGRELRGHVAKGGNGTEWHPHWHRNYRSDKEPQRTEAVCVGSFMEGEITRETTL